MALIIKDRVQETSSTTGTGTLTLAGAVTGYQTFASAIGSGNTTYYAIYAPGSSDWEVGIGTVGSGTLARTTVLASSNSGSLVNFTESSLNVWGDMPAAKGMFLDASGYASNYTIVGGTLDNAVIGGTTAAAITGTKVSANTNFVSQNFDAQSILGGNLRTSSGTTLLNWDGGGSGNITINGGLIADPANKNINLSPSGTGSVTINPATTGSMDNVVIGATTPKAITGTTITATTFSGSGANLTSIPNSALVNSAITINGTSTSLGGSINVGTVTSVTGTAPVVSSGGSTPAISMAAATSSTNGYLTSTDWSTFNGKQALLVSGTNIKTINSNSILGSGDLAITASPAGSNTQIQYNNSGSFAGNSSFTINTTTGDLTAPQTVASNALQINSTTVSTSYTVASGNNAFTVGPVTINSGVTVTVSAGQRWVVI